MWMLRQSTKRRGRGRSAEQYDRGLPKRCSRLRTRGEQRRSSARRDDAFPRSRKPIQMMSGARDAWVVVSAAAGVDMSKSGGRRKTRRDLRCRCRKAKQSFTDAVAVGCNGSHRAEERERRCDHASHQSEHRPTADWRHDAERALRIRSTVAPASHAPRHATITTENHFRYTPTGENGSVALLIASLDGSIPASENSWNE